MYEEFDASVESVKALLVELDKSENELRRLQNQLLGLKEMVWRKQNKISSSSKGSDTKLKKVEGHKEFSVKSSDASIAGSIACNKTVKSKILRYKCLIGNIESFNTETKEKKKFIDGLQKENEQDMLNKRKTCQVVNRFLETFTE